MSGRAHRGCTLNAITSSLGGPALLANATYNALGQPTGWSVADAATAALTYWGIDAAGAPYGALRTQWLAGASGSPVLVDRTLSYDLAGNVIQVADRVANETLDYGYDHLNRLTQVAGGFNESYQHDQIGNLTGIGGVVQHYPGAGEAGPRHAPIWIGSTADALTYDANGNLIARGTKALQYDPRNRLMRVAVDGATVARHTYDGEGVRTKRLDANGTIHYVGRRYERNVGNGASLPDVGTTYIEAQLGARTLLLAFRKGGQLTVVGTDHLGGTLATASAGAGLPITGRLRYTPYGQGLGASGNFGTDRGFTGQTVDAMAGLYWFASRSYDPSIGRFVQPDSVVPDWTNPQALNRYAYALNNPLKFVDPSGHDPWASDPEFRRPSPITDGAGAEPVWTDPASAPMASGTPVPSAPMLTPEAVPAPTPEGTPPEPITSPNTSAAPVQEASQPSGQTPRVSVVIGPVGPVVVVDNAPGPLSAAVMALNGGGDNTVTVNQFLVVSSTNASLDPDLMRHEMGHTRQAAVLGDAFLIIYAGLAVDTQAAVSAYNTLAGTSYSMHDWHPMELHASWAAGLGPTWHQR